ncbi:hypothetical protein INH39_32290 [Massilia violaceinigra]|uniref:Uncharacterized protein n=1 Tax=Massilia violaceinigra TaxID=2045208 RepID=A0ABY4A8S6_9BURK|nr:hypothetical protein [Massilia violaceinigra]UOD29981.1 hypothetical protein INH39_32290 [Massilia violaceinigra]
MDDKYQDQQKIPSQSMDLLRRVKGRVITKFIKKLKWEPDDFLKTFGLTENQIFEYGYGALFIELDAEMVIGLSCISKKISVSVFSADAGQVEEELVAPAWINCSDKKYSKACWANVIGKRIDSLGIIKLHDSNYEGDDGLYERGIVFILNSGNFVFTHALADAGPMDTVVMEFDELKPDIVKGMSIIMV